MRHFQWCLWKQVVAVRPSVESALQPYIVWSAVTNLLCLVTCSLFVGFMQGPICHCKSYGTICILFPSSTTNKCKISALWYFNNCSFYYITNSKWKYRDYHTTRGSNQCIAMLGYAWINLNEKRGLRSLLQIVHNSRQYSRLLWKFQTVIIHVSKQEYSNLASVWSIFTWIRNTETNYWDTKSPSDGRPKHKTVFEKKNHKKFVNFNNVSLETSHACKLSGESEQTAALPLDQL